MSMIRAYHFVGKTLRDGRPVPKDGEWLVFRGQPIMCEQGLHASIDPYDALAYAPGSTLCLVDCAGEIISGNNKLVCTKRRIVARADATELLRFFARMQAVSVLGNWKECPPDVVLDWLMTGDSSLMVAARSAAWSAAESAARSAARSAAESSAWSARSAARSAAWSAAESSAWSARSAAAESAAAESSARKFFNLLVSETFDGIS